jgi:hypothetical protein
MFELSRLLVAGGAGVQLHRLLCCI